MGAVVGVPSAEKATRIGPCSAKPGEAVLPWYAASTTILNRRLGSGSSGSSDVHIFRGSSETVGHRER
eukprot:COSAG04_NODE_15331_length_535_cov_1.082569_1_plen_67_part_01